MSTTPILAQNSRQREIGTYLDSVDAVYTKLEDVELFSNVAELLNSEKTIGSPLTLKELPLGWFH